MRTTLQQPSTFLRACLLTILLAGGVVYAQFAQPSASPVSGQDDVVNVGTAAQTKSGSLWVDALVTDNPTGKLCIGSDSNCRTSWSTSQSIGDCRLETTQLISPSWMPGADLTTQSCDVMLTPSSLAAGWVSSGANYSTKVSSSDGQPPAVCVYTRLRCSGVTVTTKPSVVATAWPVANFSKSTYQCSDLVDSEAALTKLANPATLPTGNGNGVAYSQSGDLLAVAHDTTPFVTVYSVVGAVYTKLTNPASLPAGNANSVSFSNDGSYLGVAHATTPFVSIYRRGPANTLVKLQNPATLPTGTGYGVTFSKNGKYMVVAHATTPFITIYKRSGVHGEVFTKLANPATLPTGQANAVRFSSDSKFLAVAHDATPYITVYEVNGADVFTKLANPASLPPGNAKGVDWQDDGIRFAVVHAGSPYVKRYLVTAGSPSTFADVGEAAIPSMSSITTRGSIAFSTTPAGGGMLGGIYAYIAAASETTPFINAYSMENVFKGSPVNTKLANPATLPTGAGRGSAVSPDNKYFAIAHVNTPFVSIYRNGADGLIDYPNDPECSSWWDNTEGVVEATIACSDGVDNDSDGLIDYASDGTGDSGCTAASDATE